MRSQARAVVVGGGATRLEAPTSGAARRSMTATPASAASPPRLVVRLRPLDRHGLCEAHAAVGTRLQVRMLDRLLRAEITEDSPYDPTNARIRQDG